MTKRVLVVEDDSANRNAIVLLLKKNGFEAHGVASAKKVQSQKLEEVDVALIDIHLPDLPGDKLAQRIKQDYPSVKVLLMTAYPVDTDAIAPGATVFSKPLNIERLLKVL